MRMVGGLDCRRTCGMRQGCGQLSLAGAPLLALQLYSDHW